MSGKWPWLEVTSYFMLCAFNPERGHLGCVLKAYDNASKHPAKTGNKKWEEDKVFLLVEVSVLAGLKCL